MCKEDIDVSGFSDTRDAYEVQERLNGLPAVEHVEANPVTKTITVEYDESRLDHDTLLDQLEQNGCTPTERLTGVFGTIKKKLTT
jgi:copper chaperone CopZ